LQSKRRTLLLAWDTNDLEKKPGRARLPYFATRGATPEERVAAFIDDGRKSPCWLAGLEFDALVWDVTSEVKVRQGRPVEAGLQRVNLTRNSVREQAERKALPLCVREFTPGFLKMTRKISISVLRLRVYAFRHLGAALEAHGFCSVVQCNYSVLDATMKLASSTLGSESTAAIANQLHLIISFLVKHKMTTVSLRGWRWIEGASALPNHDVASIKPESNPLPAPNFIRDLGHAFRSATNPVDVVVSGALALQVGCLGPRISEVLNLEEDCDEGLDDDLSLALRWLEAKGHDSELLDVPDALAGVVRLALSRCRAATEGARAAKRWYNQHPDQIYLPPQFEHLRSRIWLTPEEAAPLIGAGCKTCQRIRLLGIRLEPRDSGGDPRWLRLRFADLERRILAELPQRMRDAGGPAHHPLFIVNWKSFKFGAGVQGSPCMFETVTPAQIRDSLRARGRSLEAFREAGFGLTQVEHRTHPTRHFFGSLARARGVSDADIAYFSRRTGTHHHWQYDHVPLSTADAVLAAVSESLASGEKPDDDLQRLLDGLSNGAASLDAFGDYLMHRQGLRPAEDPRIEELAR
jgi:hypothetical protein